ncbi:hypothetical protein GUITHDRAFT_121974 [Guillardia theta CCMP2712]|uniref:Formamidase n=1 Tax=Guillardia theta (strain CCMP2712) TaxID=905079 RepID=L1I7I3_GUITC|nr:hypothetical protein GUITHDRAFT_121974 [Guillardia theta CCMP2712]EKX31839.1 hypothetical protein GUITHDRAFT_121974 [Guillardia theta CCMP2712]|eukprot:XP_005818819.1 hypothetical protein GUITHDRAFT_121974 [Guillardia theta CCMP2712]
MAASEGSFFIPKSKSATKFLPDAPPALTVCSGAIVSFETTDISYERLSRGEQVEVEEINIVTGPLYVKDAQPGDCLEVEVLGIEITRCWSVWIADERVCGCLASKLAATGRSSSVRELELRGGSHVMVSDRLQLPLKPMIGCIATAPAPHSSHAFGCGCSTFEPTYEHGGNMDLKELSTGSKVLLPVLCEGGMLYVGDLHACMAAGEPAWVGFEAAGVARVRDVIFTAVGTDHEDALQKALEQAYDHLTGKEGSLPDSGNQVLTAEEAFAYCVAKADVRFGGPASRQVLIKVSDVSQFIV